MIADKFIKGAKGKNSFFFLSMRAKHIPRTEANNKKCGKVSK